MTFRWKVTDEFEAAERVPAAAEGTGLCPDEFRDRVVICTLHDGEHLPTKIADSPRVARARDDGSLFEHYARMRDWGANLVASRLAARLGLPFWHRVNVARLVMDFNRFPGSSPPHAKPLERLAINGVMAGQLNHVEKRYILEQWYDHVSSALEEALRSALIVVCVHTYDAYNSTLTSRPAVSLLSRSHSYQRDSRLPYGTFDPLFPDVLAESSVKRILRDRIALTLEKSGIHVEHNYPYCLPDGSMEIRCQPWFFFRHLKEHFEAAHPATCEDPAYGRVWTMLLNTNLRSADSGSLSGYLHRFTAAPPGLDHEFNQARAAYGAVEKHLAAHERLAHAYRMSADRRSALCVEVRKDLLSDFKDGVPVGAAHEEAADQIAAGIARGLVTYLVTDRPEALAVESL